MIKKIVIGIICILALIAIAFTLELGGLGWKMFFAPKHEAVRRKVFKQTRSYNEGKMQDLAKYKFEYEKADISGKAVIVSTIRHMFADFQCEDLPAELKTFLKKIRGY
uniref:Uncharacterized protein n=1 Tax=viral metagenome TaxID=1070528 RepID=A0A6M3JE76_9ZZZZ